MVSSRPRKHRGIEGGGGSTCARSSFFCPAAGKCFARAHAQGKAYCLDQGHQGEYDAHGTGGTGADLRHEISVGHVVHRCHQHADDGGNGQAGDQPPHREWWSF